MKHASCGSLELLLQESFERASRALWRSRRRCHGLRPARTADFRAILRGDATTAFHPGRPECDSCSGSGRVRAIDEGLNYRPAPARDGAVNVELGAMTADPPKFEHPRPQTCTSGPHRIGVR